ncbi:MAG: undecaprenyl/decaprenyl-phosphate alpha-N-acetylglucosaminyl 1-phosphate transferase [Nitrospinae bacterium]|nr:undecaprenyl/decaprenyl-phosphate alpha-N-acetylglucosaminyl 1-phosphate transferase [Nitrospinota bacterium]
MAAGLGIFCFIFAISFGLTRAVISVSRKFSLYSVPRTNRWNDRRISNHGGVGIWIAFSLGFFLFKGMELSPVEWVVWISSTVMFFVGLFDDLFTLSPKYKLGFQIVITILAVNSGIMFSFFDSYWMNVSVTALWLIGLNNAINLLDNMDGASAGIVLNTVSSLAFLPHHMEPELALSCLILGASVLGFLCFNFYPAKIFMGDSGSLFLGNLCSMLLLLFSQTISPEVFHTALELPSAFLLPVLIIFTPILDTSFVFINRKLNGYPVSQGDKGHITHRLSHIVGSDRKAVLFLYVYQLVIALIVASCYWTLLYPFMFGTILGLIPLTLVTNHLVWPEKYPVPKK